MGGFTTIHVLVRGGGAIMTDGWDLEVNSSTYDPDKFELAPAGNWPGVICAILEVGTHDDTDQNGAPVTLRKVIIGYEMTSRKADGSPFVMSQEFTYSMHTSANLFKLVEKLTGARKEGEKFNPKPLLGMPVMVEVVHTPGQTKKGQDVTYANIKGVGSFPAGYAPPVGTRAPLLWGTFEGKAIPDVSFLPPVYGRKIIDLIRGSHEFRQGRIPAGAADAGGGAGIAAPSVPAGTVQVPPPMVPLQSGPSPAARQPVMAGTGARPDVPF
jgi:hypothetical protein